LTSKKDTSFFGDFKGLTIASARTTAEIATRVPNAAGIGKLTALAGRSASVRFRE
jgi:hypothetical protein